MSTKSPQPWGYHWRSSQAFIISTITIALFAENFLYGFLVPILGYMLETRVGTDPSQTQHLTDALLTCHGFSALVAAPVIAHFADKTPNRKATLLIALATSFVGTLFVACAPYLWALFLGRILQGVAGSAAWIVCFAALTDNVGPEHIGKVMGVAMSFITAGIVTGPMVAGILLELVGYWPTWCAPLVMLLLDMTARLVMIEGKDGDAHHGGILEAAEDAPPSPLLKDTGIRTTTASDPERAPLLSPDAHTDDQPIQHHEGANGIEEGLTPPPSGGFYRIVLADTRVIAGIVTSVLSSALISGFDATLPLHLYTVFNWNSMAVGMIFLSLQVPAIFLGPLVGWLRDTAGTRKPATLGLVLLAPLFWVLGLPGQNDGKWLSSETNDKIVFIICMTAIGAVMVLIRGAGGLQIRAVIHQMQSENPKIFGPYGGSSRVFSLTEISFSVGLMLGPLLAGSLSAVVGYYYMNVALAAMCLVVAAITFVFFDDKN